MLRQSDFYEKIIATNRNRVPSNKLKNNIDKYKEKTEEEKLEKVNRLALEEYYPQETPKLPNVPQKYWTRCHKLAKHLIGNQTLRWKDYVLMEAIHCFYDKESDLRKEDSMNVTRKCFDKHTKQILLLLKPKMMVLFGKAPYDLLSPYLDRGILDYKFGSLRIENLKVPVLRHPHPSSFVSKSDSFYKPEQYEQFKSYCRTFNYGE